MPIQYKQPYTKRPAIALRHWKNKQAKTLTFLDEGEDMPNTPNGPQYLYVVKLQSEPDPHGLWVRQKTDDTKISALEICLQPHVPLKGKTLKIVKTTGPNLKDTRYTATEVK